MFQEYNSGDLLWLGDWGIGWLIALALIGALVIGVSAYDLKGLKPARRFTLVAIRASVYALAVMMLLEPAIDLKHVSRVKNQVAVLVDASRSMSLKVDDQGTSRADRVTGALPELAPLIERAAQDHGFHFFTYGEQPEGITPSSRAGVEALAPTARHSNLSAALDAVGARFADEDLGGVILYSDGIDSGAMGDRTRRGEALDETSRARIVGLRAPVNAVAAASQEGLRDLAISRVLRDDFAFVHNKVSVEVELEAIGLGEKLLGVELRRDGELLQTRPLQIQEEKTRYSVTFEFVPRQIGQEIYTVIAPQLEGEALVENNAHRFVLRVIRDKIRALQVVGRPSWDERFLRRLLKRDPNIDLVSFFILRTNESLSNASTDELSLIPFPTRELFEQELGSFDLVIFQNFDFGPYNMRQYLPRIEEFVRQGGGFVMIGGDASFASGGYARTAIERALPVELPPPGVPAIDEREFRPELTEAGLRHPITQLAFDPAANRQIWSKLPAQRGTNIVRGARPDATVLATHPSLKAGAGAMPVLTVSPHGEGRVMALTTDSTWRWGFEALGDGGTPREYQLFWHNAMRWLIKDPELKLLKLEIAEDTTYPGQPIEVTVRVAEADYSPAKNRAGELLIVHAPHDPEQAPIAIAPIAIKTDSGGSASVTFTPSVEGVYTITAEVEDPEGEALKDQQLVLVVPDLRELQEIIPRDDLLAQIAAASGGAFSALHQDSSPKSPRLLEPRAVRINRRRVIQIWDSALVFALIVLLLGAEWTLRRRWGRL